jgi:alpha-glucosidase
MLLTLRGTPTMYYGDEIGLAKVEIPPDRVQDPWEKNEPGLGIGRDPERTPMQWDSSRHAGFTTGEPWLPLAPDYAHHNVEKLKHDTRSILTLYRRLIEFRRKHRALSIGSYVSIGTQEHVFAYERRYGHERLMVLLNLGHGPETMALPADAKQGRILLSTHLDRDGERITSAVQIRRDEGLIIELEAERT